MREEFFIVDLRPEWRKKPCITLWRPDDRGYTYPLAWAGRYSREQVDEGGSYYTQKGERYYQRFAVPCSIVEAMAAPLATRIVECWEAGPHLLNTGKVRMALRKARYRPTQTAALHSRQGERQEGRDGEG